MRGKSAGRDDAKPAGRDDGKSAFVEVSVERRVDDDTEKARYNKFKNSTESKEYMSRTTRNRAKGVNKTFSAKRRGKDEWDVTQYDGPKSANSKPTQSKQANLSPKDAFSSFPELSVDKLVSSIGGGAKKSRKRSRSRKRSSKRGSRKGGSRKRGSRKS